MLSIQTIHSEKAEVHFTFEISRGPLRSMWRYNGPLDYRQ
jgi:hypothetical protein